MMGKETAIASLKEKIDGLNQLAWEVRVNDSPKAFQLSEESVKLARSINYTKGLAEGLRSLGFAYIRLFKNEEAAPLLREALSLFQSLNDIKGQAITYEYLGIIERNWGNLGTSLELLLKGDALIRQVGSVEIEVTSSYQIGVTYKHLGNHENALDYLYKALSIAKSSGNILMEAYATNIIGSIYFDNGDYKHALDCYQRGLVIRRESHDKWGEAGSLDNIGITYLKLNDLDKAIDYCKQSLKITQSTGDKKGEANTLLHLGEIFQQAGDIGQASRFSNESLEIRKARGDKRGEAEVLLFLVDLNKDRIDTDDHQIFEWLSGALKIADEIKAQDLLSKSYYNLHEYYRQKGNHKQSLIHLEAHLQIEKELHKNTINQKVANLEISHKAEVISERNKELTELNEQIEKANAELKIEASLERVRAVAMGMKEPADMINVCRRISDQLQQLGFKEIRNVQTAIIYPEKHVYLNYQYFTPYDKESIETIDYRLHPDVLEFSRIMLASPDAYYTKTFEGEELKVWREYRKQTNQLPDPKLDATTSSHYYFYSIGSGALGVTTYAPLSEEQIELFKRFRNVFELAYRRFIDIEKALAQAREAQIQLTLERVRARTMAMHHSEELSEVVKLLYQEFDKLKINNESTDIEIGLIDEETGVASIWAHFYLSDGTISTFKLPFTLFEEINDEFKKWKATPVEKRNELFFTTEFSAEQWQRYMNIIEKLPELAEIFRPLLEAKITKWVTHNAYFSHGILTLQGTEAYSQETQEIQKRFAKVFEQTYTRFLDLKKAEAQTREAQIEAALERVRAKSMAMHHSDDLITVINVVQEQLLGLGFHFHAANFVTDYSEKGYTMWLASPGESFPHKIYVPQVGLKYFEAVNAAIEKGSDFATYTLNFEEKNIYFKSLFESSLAKSTSEEGKRKVNESKGMASSVVLLDKVRLNLMNLDMIPFTDEENNILKRFGYVFEQSYTRFLDLQKAEAQAREAQIEAAVEKVRSRSLAMHKSDELQEVVHTVFERLKELNVDFYTAIIILFTEGSKDIVWWLESKANQQYPRILVPFTPVSYFNDLFEKREKGADLLSKCYSFEEKNELFRHLFENTDFKYVPENQKQFLLGAEFATMSVGLAKNTGIHITSYSKKSFSDQDNLIIKRFAKVFDQAYTRFLDLQKAEAQAREAQIETGLERVRSKTMAMHKSEEVTSVAVSLNEELLKLGFEGGSTIIIINRETGDTEQWTGFSEDKSIKSCYVPYFKHPYHDALLDSWKKGENFLVYIIAGDNKISLDEHYFSTGYRIFPESDKKWMKAMGSVTFSHAYMKYGAIHWGPGQLTEEQLRILQRFSKVFEQSYTRFLDLQKAEAQAKEAQIEVALERIRARAMAMHSSNELMDVAYILREQMGLLDQPDLETSVVNLFEEDSDYIHSWHAFREPGSSSGKIINGTVSFRKDSSELTKEMIDHYHSGKKEYTLEATGEKLNEFIQVLINSEPEISNYIGKDPPEKVYYHFATFKGGALLTVSYQPTTEDIKSLQRRAASVFDMAYRRYRDLKKAEAQTREAQIEIAVERVRAKALAMHKSEEILSVVVVLRNELLGLNIPGVSGTTIYLKQDDDRIRMWDLTSVIELEDGFHLSMDIVFPLEETHPELFIRKIWNATEKYSVQIQNRNDLMRTVEWLAAYKKEEAENVKRFIETTDLRNLFHSTVPLANGKLSVDLMEPPPAEMESILQKMATAFDLAYKRFRDLQKAEAQAREAQIEAALERVRAKVMAMTSSKDLNETSLVFGEQLRKLGIDWQFSYFWLIEEAKNENTFWITWPDNKTSLTTYTLAEAEEYFNDCLVSWRAGVKIHDNYVPSEGVQEWLDTFQRIADDAGGEAKKIMVPRTFSNGVFYYDAMMKYGSFGICISKPATEEEKNIQCRFAIEFERAYTRFLDLKQAEAQAREAQIELGLERVRARAMAMQNSGELNDLVAILFEELTRLDLILARCIIWIFDIDTLSARLWMANSEDKKAAESYYIKRLQHSYYESIIRGWKERNPKWVYDLKGEEKKTIDQLLLNETELSRLPDAVKNGILNAAHTIVSGSFNNFGLLEASGPVELSGEQMDIVSRFAKVFDLTYTRFNDLKQAEAQAREAQIELGLERVRARAMAMQKSDELKELIGTVSTELSKLDIVLDRCFIMTYDIKTLGVTWWMANPETSSDPIGLYVKYHEQVPYLAFLKAWQDRIVKWQFILEGSVKKTWDEFLFVETELSRLPAFVIDNMRANEKVYLSASFNNFGCLTLATLEPLSDEQFDIMLRFAKVFDLTYTRFNDLKQAEAQAREAQIELGLEKVRAKAMAMHKSDDLKTAVATVFEELNKLDLGLIRCGIAILDKNQPRGDIWITLKSGQHSTIEVSGDEPLDIHPLLKGAYDGWLKQEDFSYTLQDEDLVSYYQAITKTNFQQSVSATFKTEKKDQQQYYFNAVFQDGSIFAFLNTAFTDEAKTVMRRFANVFNLTYKRFLDLQKAEAQAREARIETALEKIRASTMAMQRSEDLSQTAFVLFKQFKELGAEPERIFIATFDDHDSGVIDLWGTDQGGNQLNKLFKVPVNEPTMVSKIVAAWKEKKKSVVVDLKGEELKTYLGFLKQAGIPVTEGIMTDRRVQTAACFSNGVIGVTTSEPQSAEAVQLQERFAGVFDLTYTRFLDLQKAEAQAREAKIETALERVRARALAMQEPEELKEVAQVLRTEMGLLGVEELETCSIYINDESAEKAECWYALKDIRSEEKKLVNDHFALDLNDTWVGREMLHFYQSSNKQISIVMQGENRKEWIRYCEKHSTPLGGYYGEMIPDRTYHLYKFSHGAIGAAAAGDISEESWRMLSRAASVFSLAYSRFKDLTQARTDLIKLKEEKKRAEEALTELQATQKQLIQSEKMASLGELTAGIAHEIQNPLNFVNNFSDVSNELLEEMKTELEKGNAAEAREIAINVKENLEKILHHGKRADAIVKGMLQHSRSSGGQKELTDINTLAEEYLRLAYHGLRAKDKFFNAKFETDLDRSISKINVVPQEIGRVILNLINNSFYAVSEKKRGVSNGYEPSVTVSTKKINDKVEIRVKDNGNGISQKDLDKIFQPFFTTKPTGQGTGLGLSLSYDIITKGHGGEIKVETKEGEGSEFTITLPMN